MSRTRKENGSKGQREEGVKGVEGDQVPVQACRTLIKERVHAAKWQSRIGARLYSANHARSHCYLIACSGAEV
jgi:hypothetical protein